MMSYLANNSQVAPHVGAWIEISFRRGIQAPLRVAPHVGAWIEMDSSALFIVIAPSHPTWVRGLKLDGACGYDPERCVAPHVGAWIEILAPFIVKLYSHVAPHVGAWIEMIR